MVQKCLVGLTDNKSYLRFMIGSLFCEECVANCVEENVVSRSPAASELTKRQTAGSVVLTRERTWQSTVNLSATVLTCYSSVNVVYMYRDNTRLSPYNHYSQASSQQHCYITVREQHRRCTHILYLTITFYKNNTYQNDKIIHYIFKGASFA